MKITQHFGLLRILSTVNFTRAVHQPPRSNGCGPFGGKGLDTPGIVTSIPIISLELYLIFQQSLVARYGTCLGLVNMFGNIYDTKIWRWEFLIIIFALITCAAGRCMQLMRLSLLRAQENAVDRHKWVESLNNDDEGRGQIYIPCLKINTNLYHCLTFFFPLVTIC